MGGSPGYVLFSTCRAGPTRVEGDETLFTRFRDTLQMQSPKVVEVQRLSPDSSAHVHFTLFTYHRSLCALLSEGPEVHLSVALYDRAGQGCHLDLHLGRGHLVPESRYYNKALLIRQACAPGCRQNKRYVAGVEMRQHLITPSSPF